MKIHKKIYPYFAATVILSLTGCSTVSNTTSPLLEQNIVLLVLGSFSHGQNDLRVSCLLNTLSLGHSYQNPKP